jgi:predicted ATPase
VAKRFWAQGAVENAVSSVREGVAARQKTGWDLHPPYHLGIASEVLGCAGHYESAAAALAEAEMAINASNERWWEAEIHRLKGVLLLSRENTAQSEICFERQEAARAKGVQLHLLKASTESEIDAAFPTLVQLHAAAIVSGFYGRREQFVALAARHAVPAMYYWREFAEAGGLISYGSSLAAAIR